MNHAKVLTTFAAILLLTSVAAAVEDLHPEQAEQNNPNFDDFDVTQADLLDRFLNVFSLTVSSPSVEPGDTQTFEFQLEADTDQELDGSEIIEVVGIYYCDGDCNDEPNTFVEAARQDYPFSTLRSGDVLTASVDYTVPSDADLGDYEAVSYLYWAGPDGEFGTGDEQVVSDTPTTRYAVETSTVDDGDDGSDDTTQDADVVAYQEPRVEVTNTGIVGTAYLRNNGGDMQSNHILEMQVRPKGTGPLSFVGRERVCDDAHPENVHREYRLDGGDQTPITISSTDLEEDREYTVYFLTRSACWPDNDRVDPYPNAEKAGTVCFGTCDTADDGGVDPMVAAALGGVGLVVIGAGVFLLG